MIDYKTSEYKKTIGIKLDKFEWLKQIKGKKSLAGKLNEIIEYYKENKNL